MRTSALSQIGARQALNNMKTITSAGNSALRVANLPCRLRRALLGATFVSLALLAAGLARAQLLDGVEVQDGEGAASQILVRFGAPVQYLRHAPLGSGRALRVYLQLTGPGAQAADLIPTTLRFRGSARVPPFSATFPETGNALLLSFEREVSFSAGPGPDSRSIAITVSIPRN